jgi:hypothetical protein
MASVLSVLLTTSLIKVNASPILKAAKINKAIITVWSVIMGIALTKEFVKLK